MEGSKAQTAVSKNSNRLYKSIAIAYSCVEQISCIKVDHSARFSTVLLTIPINNRTPATFRRPVKPWWSEENRFLFVFGPGNLDHAR